jgi:hypothetical protein
LLKDADGPLPTRDVDALILSVVEDVVGVTRRIEAGYRLARFSVENKQLGGASGAHKQTVIGFIQSHGEIFPSFAQRPRLDHAAFFPVNNRNVAGRWHIDENPLATIP